MHRSQISPQAMTQRGYAPAGTQHLHGKIGGDHFDAGKRRLDRAAVRSSCRSTRSVAKPPMVMKRTPRACWLAQTASAIASNVVLVPSSSMNVTDRHWPEPGGQDRNAPRSPHRRLDQPMLHSPHNHFVTKSITLSVSARHVEQANGAHRLTLGRPAEPSR